MSVSSIWISMLTMFSNGESSMWGHHKTDLCSSSLQSHQNIWLTTSKVRSFNPLHIIAGDILTFLKFPGLSQMLTLLAWSFYSVFCTFCKVTCSPRPYLISPFSHASQASLHNTLHIIQSKTKSGSIFTVVCPMKSPETVVNATLFYSFLTCAAYMSIDTLDSAHSEL